MAAVMYALGPDGEAGATSKAIQAADARELGRAWAERYEGTEALDRVRVLKTLDASLSNYVVEMASAIRGTAVAYNQSEVVVMEAFGSKRSQGATVPRVHEVEAFIAGAGGCAVDPARVAREGRTSKFKEARLVAEAMALPMPSLVVHAPAQREVDKRQRHAADVEKAITALANDRERFESRDARQARLIREAEERGQRWAAKNAHSAVLHRVQAIGDVEGPADCQIALATAINGPAVGWQRSYDLTKEAFEFDDNDEDRELPEFEELLSFIKGAGGRAYSQKELDRQLAKQRDAEERVVEEQVRAENHLMALQALGEQTSKARIKRIFTKLSKAAEQRAANPNRDSAEGEAEWMFQWMSVFVTEIDSAFALGVSNRNDFLQAKEQLEWRIDRLERDREAMEEHINELRSL